MGWSAGELADLAKSWVYILLQGIPYYGNQPNVGSIQ